MQVCDSLCAELRNAREKFLECQKELERRNQDLNPTNLEGDDIQHVESDCHSSAEELDEIRIVLRLVGAEGEAHNVTIAKFFNLNMRRRSLIAYLCTIISHKNRCKTKEIATAFE